MSNLRKRKPQRRRKRKNTSKKGFFIALIFIFALSGLAGYGLTNNRHLIDEARSFISSLFNEAVVVIEGEMLVHFIDVGQGDAVLVQTAGHNVLIDGGDNHMGERLANYLRSHGVYQLSYIIATHPHADHIGGLITVLNEFYVGTVIMPDRVHTTRTFERFLDAVESNGARVQKPVLGNTFYAGDAVFTILIPTSYRARSLNDDSVGVRLVFGGHSFIFTGDAEAAWENELVQSGHTLYSNVLHVGHHGSTTSTTQSFLESVAPQFAVISVGAGNGFGHPHGAVVNRLQDFGARIYRTDLHGNIVFTTDGVTLDISHD